MTGGQMLFRRKNAFKQPVPKGQIVGVVTHQAHGNVSVRVYQAGHYDCPGGVYLPVRLEIHRLPTNKSNRVAIDADVSMNKLRLRRFHCENCTVLKKCLHGQPPGFYLMAKILWDLKQNSDFTPLLESKHFYRGGFYAQTPILSQFRLSLSHCSAYRHKMVPHCRVLRNPGLRHGNSLQMPGMRENFRRTDLSP